MAIIGLWRDSCVIDEDVKTAKPLLYVMHCSGNGGIAIHIKSHKIDCALEILVLVEASNATVLNLTLPLAPDPVSTL